MSEPRTLRSKRARALLYLAQDGKCAKCGKDLPDDWQGHHVERWSETHRTNVFEIVALHPLCHKLIHQEETKKDV